MKKMLFLLAFVMVYLATWAQRSDFQEGQFYYSINRDRPSEVSVARNDDSYSSFTGPEMMTLIPPLPVNSLFQVPLPMGDIPTL